MRGASTLRTTLSRACAVAYLLLTVGCATPLPRTDDPYEAFNRKMYAFNAAADRVIVRPIAVQYAKLTTQRERQLLNNFFANLQSPIIIGNDFLQVRPRDGFIAACRFTINSTVGVLGLFDPATKLGLENIDTDFGVTLAVWGFGEGPYFVLPFFGATSVRDALSISVDTYFFSPLYYYSSSRTLAFDAQYAPTLLYLITLRSNAMDAEALLEGVFDPYTFYRDAYRQRRVYEIYRGNPPVDIVRALQGDPENEIDSLIEEQRRYESDGRN